MLPELLQVGEIFHCLIQNKLIAPLPKVSKWGKRPMRKVGPSERILSLFQAHLEYCPLGYAVLGPHSL